MTPEEFLEIRARQYEIIDAARETIENAYKLAQKCPIPENLVPAKPSDIVLDQIIWYVDEYWSGWKIVEEVLKPSDPWKAYVAEDGCRYGLDGAYVEKTQIDP